MTQINDTFDIFLQIISANISKICLLKALPYSSSFHHYTKWLNILLNMTHALPVGLVIRNLLFIAWVDEQFHSIK